MSYFCRPRKRETRSPLEPARSRSLAPLRVRQSSPPAEASSRFVSPRKTLWLRVPPGSSRHGKPLGLGGAEVFLAEGLAGAAATPGSVRAGPERPRGYRNELGKGRAGSHCWQPCFSPSKCRVKLRACAVLIRVPRESSWARRRLPQAIPECTRVKAALAGHLSSDHSVLCIALDRRCCYFQKGVSGVFFPFMLKHRCLGFVREAVKVVTSFPAPGRSRVGCAGGWVSKSVLLPLNSL